MEEALVGSISKYRENFRETPFTALVYTMYIIMSRDETGCCGVDEDDGMLSSSPASPLIIKVTRNSFHRFILDFPAERRSKVTKKQCPLCGGAR